MMTTRDMSGGPHAYYQPHEFVDDDGTGQCFVCNLTEADGNHIAALSADISQWVLQRKREQLEKRKPRAGETGCAYCHKRTARDYESYCSERCKILHAHERQSRQPKKPVAAPQRRNAARTTGRGTDGVEHRAFGSRLEIT